MDKSTAAQTLGFFGGSAVTPAKSEAARQNGKLGGRPLIIENGAVKGCSFIYAPKGQAGEYAPLAANPYRGCGHGCLYCYVPQVLKIDRAVFSAGAHARPGFIESLKKDAAKYLKAGITEQVLLSFTSDPYHPGDMSLTTQTIEVLKDHGLAFCTLTKGGTRSFRDLPLFRPSRDAFGTTMTSLDASFSKKFEPGAAVPQDRINALKTFHNSGIFTWVSMEPTIDTEASLSIIRETHEFVDLFKIGRINYSPITKITDWKRYTLDVIELCQKLGVQHYIKRDLQCFLPPGYPNVLRVQQHR